MNLASSLRRAALISPDSVAIGYGAEIIATYSALASRVERLAGALRTKHACAFGDRVVIFSKNTPQYLEALYAIWHAGLVAVPINAKLHSEEVSFILDDVGAKLVFYSPDRAGVISDAAATRSLPALELGSPEYERMLTGEALAMAECASEDAAWIFYTSGTTGKPKGAILSMRNLLAMSACCLLDVDGISPWRTLLHAAPMSHGSGLYAIPYILRGGAHVIPESDSFDTEEIFKLIERWPSVSFFAAPTMVNRLARHPGESDLSNLKTITYGGAPMHVEDCIQALDRFGPKLSQLYGQGESPMSITALGPHFHADRDHPDWRARLGSVGVAQCLVEVRVGDENDDPVAPGETGEILVRGDTVMQGYWNNPEASADTLRNGWLHTGDLGALSADGFLTLKDRSKDLIISGGHNIYPREIEEVLIAHQDILEVAVIGKPDAEWGESVEACIVTKSGDAIDSSELDAHCLKRIARFKRPRSYRFLETLPKNNYGKVLKKDLRTDA